MRTKKAADEVESKRNSSAGRRRRKAVDADAMVETKEKNDLDAPESRVSWDQFSFVFTSTPERASAAGTEQTGKKNNPKGMLTNDWINICGSLGSLFQRFHFHQS